MSFALKDSTSKATLYEVISKIVPHDILEQKHIDDTLAWIESGAPIFRITKPDIPNNIWYLILSSLMKKFKKSCSLIIKKLVFGYPREDTLRSMKILKRR